MGLAAGATTFLQSVYPALILDYTELSNFETNVRNQQR